MLFYAILAQTTSVSHIMTKNKAKYSIKYFFGVYAIPQCLKHDHGHIFFLAKTACISRRL